MHWRNEGGCKVSEGAERKEKRERERVKKKGTDRRRSVVLLAGPVLL